MIRISRNQRMLISALLAVTMLITGVFGVSEMLAIKASARAGVDDVYPGDLVYITNWTGNAVTISSYDNGANVTMEKFTGNDRQVFEIVLKDGYYMFRNPTADKYLEVRNSGMNDCDVVGLWQDNGQLCARWFISWYDDTGLYQIRNACSYLYLNVYGNSSDPGTQVIQYHNDDTDAMKFDLVKVGSQKQNTSQFVWGDVNGDGKFTGTDASQIQSYAWGMSSSLKNPKAGDLDQNGVINSDDAELASQALVELVTLPVQYEGNKFASFISVGNASKISGSTQAIDVYSGSTSDTATVALYGYHGSSNQTFELIPMDQDYYIIKASYCDKVWDINGSSRSSKYQQLELYSQHNGNNQMFKLIKNSDGTVSFVSKDSRVLKVNPTTGVISATRYYGKSWLTKYNKFKVNYVDNPNASQSNASSNNAAQRIYNVIKKACDDAENQWYGGRDYYHEAWCADYVSDLLINQGGFDISRKSTPNWLCNEVLSKNLGTLYLYNDDFYNRTRDGFANRDEWIASGKIVKANKTDSQYYPKEGDVILFNWGYEAFDSYSHVGIVIGDYDGSGTVYTVEGNTMYEDYNDTYVAYRRRNYTADYYEIIGILRMNW